MYAHTQIFNTYIFHSMWTTQTSTRYVWETEAGEYETFEKDHLDAVILYILYIFTMFL